MFPTLKSEGISPVLSDSLNRVASCQAILFATTFSSFEQIPSCSAALQVKPSAASSVEYGRFETTMANNDQSPEPDLTRQVKRLRCMRGGHRGTATRLVRSTKDSVGMLLGGDEDLPSRLIAAEIPRLVSARDSVINKREKLKELDSQIMSLIEGEIQSQDGYEENMTIAILESESCLQHLNYAPSISVAKEESRPRPTGKIAEKAAQAQEDLKEEPEEDLQEEGEVCDEKLALSTSTLGGTVQGSSEVHARVHARDPSCGTEVSDEEAEVVQEIRIGVRRTWI